MRFNSVCYIYVVSSICNIISIILLKPVVPILKVVNFFIYLSFSSCPSVRHLLSLWVCPPLIIFPLVPQTRFRWVSSWKTCAGAPPLMSWHGSPSPCVSWCLCGRVARLRPSLNLQLVHTYSHSRFEYTIHPSFLFHPSHSLSRWVWDAKPLMVPHHSCHDLPTQAHACRGIRASHVGMRAFEWHLSFGLSM